MNEQFVPAQLAEGDVLRVKETFYASGICLPAGTVVRVVSMNCRVEERIYDLTIVLQTTDAPVRSFIWRRTQPLEKTYIERILERL